MAEQHGNIVGLLEFFANYADDTDGTTLPYLQITPMTDGYNITGWIAAIIDGDYPLLDPKMGFTYLHVRAKTLQEALDNLNTLCDPGEHGFR
jgi:hypothetical protein